MLWSCQQCGIVDLEVPDGLPVRCAHSKGSVGAGPDLVRRVCIHQSAAAVATMECGCGSAFRCNLTGKLCSYTRPIDQFVYAGDVQLTPDHFQLCGDCPDELKAKVIKVYHHSCIQTGPAVSEPPAEPVRCDVVIPFCRLDAIYLREAVESILLQEHASATIHIVADGCEFPELPNSPGIRLYRTAGDQGPYRITNALFPYFETDYLAIQDSDDISTPDRLWKQIQTLERYGIDMISGGMIQFVAADCAGDRVMVDRCKGMPRLYSGMCWHETPRGSMINSVKTMRRSLFERLDGFADWMMSADHEWDNRCAFTPGVRLYHATDVFGRRRLHNRSLSNGVFPLRSQQREQYTQLMRQNLESQKKGVDGRTLGGGLCRPILSFIDCYREHRALSMHMTVEDSGTLRQSAK